MRQNTRSEHPETGEQPLNCSIGEQTTFHALGRNAIYISDVLALSLPEKSGKRGIYCKNSVLGLVLRILDSRLCSCSITRNAPRKCNDRGKMLNKHNRPAMQTQTLSLPIQLCSSNSFCNPTMLQFLIEGAVDSTDYSKAPSPPKNFLSFFPSFFSFFGSMGPRISSKVWPVFTKLTGVSPLLLPGRMP